MKKALTILSITLLLVACGSHECKQVKNCYEVNSGLPQFSKTRLIYVNYLYHGGWTRDQEKVAQEAEDYLMHSVNNDSNNNQKLAIVTNLDETLLEYPYLLDYEPNMTLIKKHQMQGDFKAIKPAIELLNLAKKNHVSLFIITGRSPDEKAVTIKNLTEQGITGWTGIYFKPKAIKNVAQFKQSMRKMITDKGYKIIVNLGDQYSDLCGGYTEMNFKLPNPFYYVGGCDELKGN